MVLAPSPAVDNGAPGIGAPQTTAMSSGSSAIASTNQASSTLPQALSADARTVTIAPEAAAASTHGSTSLASAARDKIRKKGLFGIGKKKLVGGDVQPDAAARLTPVTRDAGATEVAQSTPTDKQSTVPARGDVTSPRIASPARSLHKHIATASMSSARAANNSPASFDPIFRAPSSPGCGMSASSVRVISPASSQIFERSVQENSLHSASPAIPSHIATEDHIPPVLDASSEAITDDRLDTDSVEIVTTTQHQTAALSLIPSIDNLAAAFHAETPKCGLISPSERDDGASIYGSPDNDIRRLSFISFADVVHAEQATQAPGSRDSSHYGGLRSFSSTNLNRPASPLRSPVTSPRVEASLPASKAASIKGGFDSPARRPLGSPISLSLMSSINSGDVVHVETMTQALTRTGSADLVPVRSPPVSPLEQR